jgi:hypothetical protein
MSYTTIPTTLSIDPRFFAHLSEPFHAAGAHHPRHYDSQGGTMISAQGLSVHFIRQEHVLCMHVMSCVRINPVCCKLLAYVCRGQRLLGKARRNKNSGKGLQGVLNRNREPKA